MNPTLARRLAVAYFVLFALAVTWPGMVPFNRIHPLVLGLPFSLAWVAMWVAGGVLVLWMVYAAEGRDGRPDASVDATERPDGDR